MESLDETARARCAAMIDKTSKLSARSLAQHLGVDATRLNKWLKREPTPSASGPGTVIAMIPKRLAEKTDVFLVRFDSGADVEMNADEVQQFCVSRGQNTSESAVEFTAAIAEGARGQVDQISQVLGCFYC